MRSLTQKSKSYRVFSKILESIIKDSGGSADKVKLKKYIDSINRSFTSATWDYWLGVRIMKNPSELIILQEIMFEKSPDTIIECGTAYGGSAYYMAGLMDLMNIDGKIITIDQSIYEPQAYPKKDFVHIDGKIVALNYDLYQSHFHPKIKFIHSDCLTADIPKVGAKTMVILDCDHSAKHVYKELEKFSKVVSLNQYIIVEDTDVYENEGDGPAAAVEEFLSKNKNFKIDRNREKYGTSTSLGGYLLRIS